jgi:hypothetical protein
MISAAKNLPLIKNPQIPKRAPPIHGVAAYKRNPIDFQEGLVFQTSRATLLF